MTLLTENTKTFHTMPTRLQLVRLLVLLAAIRQASAESLRKANLSRRNKSKKPSRGSYNPNPGNYTDKVKEGRDLLDVESRVVGGNIVTDVNKHPFFAEWNGQFCGGAVRGLQENRS
jgi:hypothetical protein